MEKYTTHSNYNQMRTYKNNNLPINKKHLQTPFTDGHSRINE